MMVFAVLIGMFPKELPKNIVKTVDEVPKSLGASTDSAFKRLQKSRLSLDGEIIGSVENIPKLKGKDFEDDFI